MASKKKQKRSPAAPQRPGRRTPQFYVNAEPIGAAAAMTAEAEWAVQQSEQAQEWSWPEELRLIGSRIPRIDGPDKATGRARYAYDRNRPRMCYGKILRSPHARARVVSIDTSAAESAPGVVALHRVAEPGAILNYHGDPIIGVAAETEEQARDARRLVRVEYEPLPHVASEEDAIRPEAAQILDDGNVREGRLDERGDPAAGFAQAVEVYEGTFRTQVETHSSLETHGLVAEWEGGNLTVWYSTQAVHGSRQDLAQYFEIPATQVRVLTPVMGGGFGSKLGGGIEGAVAAELARASGRPVKLLLERDEEHLDTGNRPSAVAELRAGVDAEGHLVAFEAQTYGTGGIGAGGGFPMPFIYGLQSGGHVLENRRRQHWDIFINGGSARAMRAPGYPQASFIMESVMDELADRLSIDPVEIRQRNLPPDSLWQEQLAMGARDIGWENRNPPGGDPTPGAIKKGLGCAIALWGTRGRGTQANCIIHPDGAVEMNCGTQDIGTGTRTVVAMITAEILGLPLDAVTPNIGDSNYPFSGASGGSTTIPSVCPAIRVTAGNALNALFERAAPELGVQPGELEAVDATIRVRGDAERSMSWRQACGLLGTEPLTVSGEWQEGLSGRGVNGAQFAAVTVDTETGVVTVDKIVAYQDCGLVVNTLTAESQVNGGVIMGIGYALFEDRILDPPTGRMVNPNFEQYLLPGPSDIPEIEVYMMNVPERGTIGLGEPPTVPTAAAIANAVANAIGVRIHSLPITPDKVLAALEEGPEATFRPPRFDWLPSSAAGAEGRARR